MKSLLIALVSLSSLSALADPANPIVTTGYNLTCEGKSTSTTDGAARKVQLNFGGDLQHVFVVESPADAISERPDGRDYKVDQFLDMFPVTTLTASEDGRPHDGELVEIGVSVHTGSVSLQSEHPGGLTIKSTWFDRIKKVEVTSTRQYEVSCVIAQ